MHGIEHESEKGGVSKDGLDTPMFTPARRSSANFSTLLTFGPACRIHLIERSRRAELVERTNRRDDGRLYTRYARNHVETAMAQAREDRSTCTLRWNLVSSVGTWALVGSSEADHSMREEEDMVDVDGEGEG